MTTRRKKIYVSLAVIVPVLLIAAAAAGVIMSRVEQPNYKVTMTEGAIEIRSYGPMIAAEAEVKGERKAAINEGFRLIAAYIFGANRPNAKIAMTAPVQQQSTQTIAMTAPVTQQTTGDSWTVRFFMPSSWTLETLPLPNDARVTLKPVPAKRILAVRFSGTASDGLLKAKTESLETYAADKKLVTVGQPVMAFYNPPWTLPVFRRNEIMFELAQSN